MNNLQIWVVENDYYDELYGLKILIYYSNWKQKCTYSVKSQMGIIQASPQSINLFLVSLLFIPRFFSEAAYQTGTVLILIFWIVPFVLIPEMASENWNVKSKLSGLPKSTSSILAICLILIFVSFYWRKIKNYRYGL